MHEFVNHTQKEYARGDVHESLKEGGRGGTEHSRASGRMRNALVVAEMSLALVLLAGAGLMVRSFAALQQVNLGFDPAHALTGRVSLPARTYQTDTAITQFFERAESEIASLPGVQAVGAISYLPLTGQRSVNGFNVEGRPPAKPGEEPGGDMRAVTPGYFRAMGIPLKTGRVFTDADRKGTPDVAPSDIATAIKFCKVASNASRRALYQLGRAYAANRRAIIEGFIDADSVAACVREVGLRLR